MTPLLFALRTTTPSPADVLAMMRLVPAECALSGACPDVPAGFDRARDAPAISAAIAAGVVDEPDPWGRAALGVVYSAYESGNRACPASGDGGRSHGLFQLQGVSKLVACDPPRAFRVWLGVVRASEHACSANAPGEELAALESGSCLRARRKSKRRAELAARIGGRS